MFLSASRIEKNKAAGLGVAGRRMPEALPPGAPAAERAPAAHPRLGVLARALLRYGEPGSRKAA